MYVHRLAKIEDTKAIAPLWDNFARERAEADPSMVLKPNFDFEACVRYHLTQPLSYCWVLEDSGNSSAIVGCLFTYFYDEAPPENTDEIWPDDEFDTPFEPRRICAALGLYVRPEHRNYKTIKKLIDAGISHAEQIQVTDIDLLIASDQTGIQALLERSHFAKVGIEYSRRFDLPDNTDLPNLHSPNLDRDFPPTSPTQTMSYTSRPATVEDVKAIAPLWAEFARDRATVDPSMALRTDFDFDRYIARQLTKPLSYSWVLEHSEEGKPGAMVGCLFVYFYDEAPPPELPEELLAEHDIENPFASRRVGSVLGMYVRPEHRQPEAIKLLADAGVQKAEELKVTDIDILVGADQTGMHSLLQRLGFTQSAVQYTKHYNISPNTELKSLHPPHPETDVPGLPEPSAIPLRDPKTNELAINPQGEPVFLLPLRDENGELLKTSGNLPVYSTPVRDPQTQEFVFDCQGNLVTCPILRDDDGSLFEFDGIPQFRPPLYAMVEGKLQLQVDGSGNYLFCEVERDKQGQIVRSPEGKPVFKRSIPSVV